MTCAVCGKKLETGDTFTIIDGVTLCGLCAMMKAMNRT